MSNDSVTSISDKANHRDDGSRYSTFYGERRHETYAQDYTRLKAEDHRSYRILKAFIQKHDLEGKRCLEIGSSGGFFQDMVTDYYGTDISEDLAVHYHKPYRVVAGTKFPFADNMFDAIWTFAVYEHIPHLQEALLEIRRLLKPGGVVLFEPAWQCRSWAAQGYPVRPYHDFGLKGKLIKATIPLRDNVLWRSMYIVPKRLVSHLAFLVGYKYERIRYKKIDANYDIYWMADSDACNHIDPHDAILWFCSNGFQCLSHPLQLSAFFVRTGALVFRKSEL